MRKSKNAKGLPKTKHISSMISINPNGYWSLGELIYEDTSKNCM